MHVRLWELVFPIGRLRQKCGRVFRFVQISVFTNVAWSAEEVEVGHSRDK